MQALPERRRRPTRAGALPHPMPRRAAPQRKRSAVTCSARASRSASASVSVALAAARPSGFQLQSGTSIWTSGPMEGPASVPSPNTPIPTGGSDAARSRRTAEAAASTRPSDATTSERSPACSTPRGTAANGSSASSVPVGSPVRAASSARSAVAARRASRSASRAAARSSRARRASSSVASPSRSRASAPSRSRLASSSAPALLASAAGRRHHFRRTAVVHRPLRPAAPARSTSAVAATSDFCALRAAERPSPLTRSAAGRWLPRCSVDRAPDWTWGLYRSPRDPLTVPSARSTHRERPPPTDPLEGRSRTTSSASTGPADAAPDPHQPHQFTRPNRRNRTGTTNMFQDGAGQQPTEQDHPIGASISFPASSAARTRERARPAHNAVMTTGARRSTEPRNTASSSGSPSTRTRCS